MTKILIVEDEAILALNAEIGLTRLGYEIIGIASNGVDAVRIAREQRPDIVLMDIVLKGSMNGIEAVSEINKDTKCKIIYMTGHSDAATVDMARRTAYVGFLFKPLEIYQLRDAIDEALK